MEKEIEAPSRPETEEMLSRGDGDTERVLYTTVRLYTAGSTAYPSRHQRLLPPRRPCALRASPDAEIESA